MIKLIVIAGEKSANLSKFLEDKGTFSVDYHYESITKDLNQIHGKIIRTDKMLYLYQSDSGIDIKSEMVALKKLLSSEGFFDPGEIVLITDEGSNAKAAIRFFNSVMQSCHYEDFNVKTLSGIISYANVYQELMGVSTSQNFKNVYHKLYRVNRGSEATTAFHSQDDTDLKIEPFNFERLEQYKRQKDVSVRTDSGIPICESIDTDKITFDNPDLGGILHKTLIGKAKTTVITGNAKTGKTIWCGALASSALVHKHSCLILDFTNNGDVSSTLDGNSIGHYKIKMIDLLQVNRCESGTLTVCGIVNEHENRVILEFLNWFYSREIQFQDVFIVCETNLLDTLGKILNGYLNNLIITTFPLKEDILFLQAFFNEAQLFQNILIVINDNIKLMNFNKTVELSKIHDMLPYKVSIVPPHYFENFEVGGSIYTVMLGGDYG